MNHLIILVNIFCFILISNHSNGETVDYDDGVSVLQSHTLKINTSSIELMSHILSEQIKEHGFIFIDNSSFKTTGSFSKVAAKINDYYYNNDNLNDLFSYKLGTVYGRNLVESNVYSVGNVAANVLLTGHSEASYMNESTPYLLFQCPLPSNIGGETILYSINEFISRLNETLIGKNLLNNISEYGVIYIRNDISDNNMKYKQLFKCLSSPSWQQRFNTSNKQEVIQLFNGKDIDIYWNEKDTFIQKWHGSGFRKHPLTNNWRNKIWFNQLFTLNARYYNQHNCSGTDELSYDERPFHSLVGSSNGNGRELTDKEYELMWNIHNEIEILIPWDNNGDILAIDNFVYQHGRKPFIGDRRCIVHLGASVISQTQCID